MQSIRKRLDQILGGVCTILFIFMTCIGTYQIVTRYVFNSPSTVSEELLTFSFTWMSLLAATYVFGKRDHMRMSFLADKTSGKTAIWLMVAAEIFIFIFSSLVMVYGGIAITRLTMTQITASLGVPMAYVYIIVPICGILTMVYNILNISELTAKMKLE